METSTALEPQFIVPIACTLDAQGQADRVQQWQAVLARATGRAETSGGIRVSFPADPALVAQLAELAVHEQQCCAFFRFAITIAGGGEVAFEVSAPAEALQTVIALFGSP